MIIQFQRADAVGDVFHLVGPVSTPSVAAAKLLAEHTERPHLDVKMPFLWAFNASNDKAQSILGYAPQYDFAKMVDSALAFRRGEDIGVIPV
ncbi:hypothetical protein KFU94_26900 [Chloroflexi bacterium TSY]|nr:hypothetical protein [Chloroflexi bacterium TSY]